MGAAVVDARKRAYYHLCQHECSGVLVIICASMGPAFVDARTVMSVFMFTCKDTEQRKHANSSKHARNNSVLDGGVSNQKNPNKQTERHSDKQTKKQADKKQTTTHHILVSRALSEVCHLYHPDLAQDDSQTRPYSTNMVWACGLW